MFPTSVIIDLAIAAALVLCIVIGRKRGLFRSFMGLATVVIALSLASRAADLGSDLVIEQLLRPAANAAIEQRVDEMLSEPVLTTSPMQEMEEIILAIPHPLIREKAGELLKKMELSTESTITHTSREVLLAMADGLLDTVLNTAVRSIIHTVIFLIVFLTATLLLKFLTRALDVTLQLPLLRQLNQFGGLLFGTAEGVVLVCVAVGFLGYASLWVTPETIRGSVLLKYVAQWVGLPTA